MGLCPQAPQLLVGPAATESTFHTPTAALSCLCFPGSGGPQLRVSLFSGARCAFHTDSILLATLPGPVRGADFLVSWSLRQATLAPRRSWCYADRRHRRDSARRQLGARHGGYMGGVSGGVL